MVVVPTTIISSVVGTTNMCFVKATKPPLPSPLFDPPPPGPPSHPSEGVSSSLSPCQMTGGRYLVPQRRMIELLGEVDIGYVAVIALVF